MFYLFCHSFKKRASRKKSSLLLNLPQEIRNDVKVRSGENPISVKIRDGIFIFPLHAENLLIQICSSANAIINSSIESAFLPIRLIFNIPVVLLDGVFISICGTSFRRIFNPSE